MLVIAIATTGAAANVDAAAGATERLESGRSIRGIMSDRRSQPVGTRTMHQGAVRGALQAAR